MPGTGTYYYLLVSAEGRSSGSSPGLKLKISIILCKKRYEEGGNVGSWKKTSVIVLTFAILACFSVNCNRKIKKEIFVTSDLTADFSADPRLGDPPLSVQFTYIPTSNAGSIGSWKWDFNNDGTIDSTEQNPVHVYTELGTYTVSLTVSFSGDADAHGLIVEIDSSFTETKVDYILVANIIEVTKTIQEAIDEADNGSIVVVPDGIYTGDQGDGLRRNKNLELRGKVIVVQSENGPDNCIIDCESSGRGFNVHEGENTTTIIRGFSIKNGNIVGSGSGGGGINCTDNSSPTIDNCIVTNNKVTGTGSGGGGINCHYSDAIIKNCTVTSNYIDGPHGGAHGGGISIRIGAAMVINCTVSNNHSGTAGGGINADQLSGTGPATITNCTIDNNSAWWGGGLDLTYGWSVVENCTITNNRAHGWDESSHRYSGWGAGIYAGYISAGGGGKSTITNCVISGNKATSSGGGVECWSIKRCEIRNCLIINNSHSGITNIDEGDNAMIITNCVIAGNCPVNRGYGIVFMSGARGIITNSIIWGNNAVEELTIGIRGNNMGGDVTISHCTIDNEKVDDPDGHITWGAGNIHSDPLFVGGDPFDYHFQAGSLCIDAGDNSVIDWDKDLDGNARILNGIIDMGVYEK
jgi:PKD repeat protein